MSLKTKKPPVPFAREQEAAKDDGKRLLLLEHGQARAFVFDDFVAVGEFVEGTRFDFTAEIVQLGDATVGAFLLLEVEVIGFAGFLADDAEGHNMLLVGCLPDGRTKEGKFN